MLARTWKRKTLLTAVLSAAALVGCAGDNAGSFFSGVPASDNSGQVVLRFDSPPPGVDSVQAVFLNSRGQRIGGVVEVPLDGTNFVLSNVPPEAVEIQVDYLRNGGFAVFESRHARGGLVKDGTLLRAEFSSTERPLLSAASPGRSTWTTALAPARVNVRTTGNPGMDQEVGPVVFPVRGVGYSPAPIGFSNKDGPGFGDLFWDGFYIQGAGQLLDWEKVWKRDLDNIRARFNCVRTYSLISEHTNEVGQFVTPPVSRQHSKFLDACWNNGYEPVYVLVGIPLPSDCFLADGNAQNRANFERVLQATLAETANHPAVMGYTLFNEIGGAAEWGGDAAKSEFYWAQVKKYSEQAKAAAPDKLVGFAYFDAPGNVQSASANGYLQNFGSSLDYWGVNSFQGSVIGPTLAPYKNLGSATKPVIFTEFGVPATTHTVTEVCQGDKPTQAGVNSIVANAQTISVAAQAMRRMLPIVLGDEIVAGMFYFEWNDEFWKQDPSLPCFNTGKATQEGGTVADSSQLPNGFNDEEGFGLHGIALNGRAADQLFSPFDPNAPTANNRPDTLTPRSELLEAVSEAFRPIR